MSWNQGYGQPAPQQQQQQQKQQQQAYGGGYQYGQQMPVQQTGMQQPNFGAHLLVHQTGPRTASCRN